MSAAVRPARIADIQFMLEVAGKSATAAQWMRRDYEQIFASQAPLRHALIAEEEGSAQGFIVARALPPEWEIENIVVVPTARRRGIGKRLVGEMLKRARSGGAEQVFLEVRGSNQEARALYEACGFTMAGHRAVYYQDPQEDAVLYQLSFPQERKIS